MQGFGAFCGENASDDLAEIIFSSPIAGQSHKKSLAKELFRQQLQEMDLYEDHNARKERLSRDAEIK